MLTIIERMLTYMETASYSQIKIVEAAKNLRKLEAVYKDSDYKGVEDGRQFEELAGMLEGLLSTSVSKQEERKLKKALARCGVKTNSLSVYHKNDRRVEIVMSACTMHKNCVKVAKVAYVLSEYFNRDISPVRGGRSIVTENEGEFVFEDTPEYFTLFGGLAISKDKNKICGDSYTYVDHLCGRAYVALADGMGCGASANKSSNDAIELFELLLESGFSLSTGIKMVNSAMVARKKEEPVTFDALEINLHSGKCHGVKCGAAATFVKKRNTVDVIRPSSLPMGMLEKCHQDDFDILLQNGDYVIMISDGIADALPFYDKEYRLSQLIGDLKSQNPKHMASELMDEILFYIDGEYRDDMTILVTGIWKNNNT